MLVERVYPGSREGQEGICLERSLLAYRFLSGAGADPRLLIGIRVGGGSVIGHAWVVVDGEPLFEQGADFETFFAFGRDGTLETSTPDGVPAREPVTG